MCGIWGYIGSTGTLPVSDAWEGLCSLTHRGPDDWGMYVADAGKVTDRSALPEGRTEVALGNRRLSILDLSKAGNQPMSAADGRFWIVYNGEVYNYQELREELRDCGHSFTSETDTEVVLRAFQEFGPSCVDRFRGMFAFAIWDTADERLFAARDRFGIKPFYYDLNDERFAFASEVTSLLEAGVSKPTLDPVGVDGFLTFGSVPAPGTIIDGVRSLPAGATLTFERGDHTCDIESYWTPDFSGNEQASSDRLRELLRESVRLRLRSDVSVGAFLSGGLDSSTVVALMREVAGESYDDLHTFSVGFDHEEYSETDFAEEVAAALGTTHTSRTVTPADVRDHLDDIVRAMDQPTIDGVNTYFVSQTAADAGLRVALSGLGSDELLFGYPTFRQVPRLYRACRVLGRVPRTLREGVADVLDRSYGVVNAPLATGADLLRSDAPFGVSYVASRGLFGTRRRRELLETDTTVDWATRAEQTIEGTLASAGDQDAVSHAELAWYMHNQLLRDTDAMAMAHSLEVRVPFLDSRFAEYAMGLDSEAKARGEKALLKTAMEDSLPASVLDRDKSGFTFPFAEWLRNDLQVVVERVLTPTMLNRTPLDSKACIAVVTAFENGEVHWSRLWTLVVLSLWVNEHITPSSSE